MIVTSVIRMGTATLLVATLMASCGGSGGADQTQSDPQTSRRASPRTTGDVELRRIGRLPEPAQLPSVAMLANNRALALGGLGSTDTSTDGIVSIGPSGAARAVGRLPAPLHDSAAASIAGRAYLFGGGDAAPSDRILRVAANGQATSVGRLPVAASDVAAATVGSTAYVVGGYTGTTALRSVLAFSPGRPVRQVATLPVPLRYAAVSAVGRSLLIAGGTSGSTAQRAILRYRPGATGVTRIGRLPQPLTHAAGVSMGGRFYVVGGRGDQADSASAAIWSVDPATGHVRKAGRLPSALSDVAAVGESDSFLVIAGRDRAGAVHAEILRARPRVVARPRNAAGAVPPLLSRRDVYAADRAGRMSRVVRHFPARIYVPNSESDTVDVIDPRTYRVVGHFATGAQPQHVTPSYDLKTLWVDNDQGNSLTPIDPRTGRPGKRVHVDDPYNLYFTPSGRYAIVVAERLKRLDFRDAHSMKLRHSLAVPTCSGVDHMDFTANGRYALASCEFGGTMIVVEIPHQRVVRTLRLRRGSMPQDVKLSPDGDTFYVADMASGGVWKIDAHRFRKAGFTRTGKGAHGLYASRDSRVLFVSNRDEGSISLISFRKRRVVDKWRLPDPASPDMGGVSPSGRVLWLSGRYDGEVYAISTRTGRLIKRIKVGSQPHGLCVYPQPGRYSLGHTGVFR